MANKSLDENVLIDISGCHKSGYCLLREIIKHTGLSGYMLEQMRCVDDFKWEIGERVGSHIKWEDMDEDRRSEIAFNLWVDTGYAKKFKEVYEEGKNHRQLYDDVVNGNLNDTQLLELFSKIIEKETRKSVPAEFSKTA